MRSAYTIAFVIGWTVLSVFASDSSDVALETALQQDDSCANNEDGKCSVEFLQRQALAKDATADAEDEVEEATAECCKWGQHRTCTKQRHCENGHCQTVDHCHTEKPCTAWYRQRRTCTKQRHCQNGHCQTVDHCHTEKYCSPTLLQEGEDAAEEEQDSVGSAADSSEEADANDGEDEEVVEEDDGSADSAEAAKEVSETDEASGCSLAEQGTHCFNDRDCDGRFACCQDTVAKKVGVRECHSCSRTCHPETHKCKCN